MTTFTSDINLFGDPDEGLRIDAPETFVPELTRVLTDAGLTVGNMRTSIHGTGNIPSLVEVAVSKGSFDTMKATIHEALVSKGVKVSEENFSALGEKHIRFNLDNVSVFER